MSAARRDRTDSTPLRPLGGPAPHAGQRPRPARANGTSPRRATRPGIGARRASSQRPRRSRQKRIGPASCSWYSTRSTCKTQQRARPAGFLLRARPAGFLLSDFFRRQPSGALTVRAKITAFSRVRRKKHHHGGGSRGLFPSKVSTAARPVPQNPSGHPHSPSPTDTRRQTPRPRGT
jgi:hypothetical protein